MNPSAFQPEAGAPKIEDSFFKEGSPQSPSDRLSSAFLESKEGAREGTLEHSFLKDTEITNPLEGDISIESRIIRNKVEGCRREQEVYAQLGEQYPESEGFKILSERYLLDKNGSMQRDPLSPHTCRRVDIVVADSENNPIRSIEVTSVSASKEEQTAKESRIRDAGGTFVRDPDTGQLIDLSKTPTEILRIL